MLITRGIVLVNELVLAVIRIVLEPVSWVDGELPLLQPRMPPRRSAESPSILINPGRPRPAFRIRPRHRTDKDSRRRPNPLAELTPAVPVFALVIVRVVVVELPAVMLSWAGLKLQLIPIGNPLQLKFTAPASPARDLACTVIALEVVP
jgi:hypothetical protein